MARPIVNITVNEEPVDSGSIADKLPLPPKIRPGPRSFKLQQEAKLIKRYFIKIYWLCADAAPSLLQLSDPCISYGPTAQQKFGDHHAPKLFHKSTC